MSHQDPYGQASSRAPGYGQQQPYGQPPPYGYQQQPPPAAKGGGCLKPLLIAVVVVVGLLVVGSVAGLLAASDGDSESDGTTAGETPAAAGGEDVYAVGETAHTGDFDVTVHTVTDPFVPTGEFESQPQPGHRFVAVELTMTNTSDEPLPVSMATTEMTDHLDRLGTWTLAGATELPNIDSPSSAPGAPRRGWVVFEVAADATELKLRVKGNLTATGSLFEL